MKWNRALKRFSLIMILAAVFSFSGMTLAQGDEKEMEADKIPVTFLSYNIHHGLGADGIFSLQRIGDVLVSSGADVIGIQEIDRHWSERSQFEDQVAWLAEYIGYEHYVFGANLDRDPLTEGGERRQYGTAVISKYPIIYSENQFLTSSPREQRGLLKTTINIKGNHVHFYNTHLGLDTLERQTQAREIVEIVSSKGGPSIIVGDLNAAPDTAEILTMSAAFQDAFADQNDAYTWPSNDLRVRADYIFYTPDLEKARAEAIHSLASDHLPVMAEFILKGHE